MRNPPFRGGGATANFVGAPWLPASASMAGSMTIGPGGAATGETAGAGDEVTAAVSTAETIGAARRDLFPRTSPAAHATATTAATIHHIVVEARAARLENCALDTGAGGTTDTVGANAGPEPDAGSGAATVAATAAMLGADAGASAAIRGTDCAACTGENGASAAASSAMLLHR